MTTTRHLKKLLGRMDFVVVDLGEKKEGQRPTKAIIATGSKEYLPRI